MIHKSNEFNAIMALASEFGLTNVIAGGYPRDLALGRTPKDLDICVYNITQNTWDEFKSQVYLYDLVEEEIDVNPPSSTGDNRVTDVLKIKGNIDIVLWNDSFEYMKDVVDNFDFNINQWILSFPCDYNGEPYDVEPTPVFIGDFKLYGKLTQIFATGFFVSDCRRAKIENLAKEFNWSIECPMNKTPLWKLQTKKQNKLK